MGILRPIGGDPLGNNPHLSPGIAGPKAKPPFERTGVSGHHGPCLAVSCRMFASLVMRGMSWPDQNPPAIDVLLRAVLRRRSPAYLEIDKLPDGWYRATVGTLFEYQEL